MVEPVIEALAAKLAQITVGDPRAETTRMGALVSAGAAADVLDKAALIGTEAERVFGDPDAFAVQNADAEAGAFLSPMLFRCADPDRAQHVHAVEAFGPVSTVMGYRDIDHAIALANRGRQGSLVTSAITHDPETARRVALGRRLARTDLLQRPHLDGRGHGPRRADAAYGPWRPGPRRRRRGNGRCARCDALHAAHRGAGLTRYPDRDHRALRARRGATRRPRPSRSAAALASCGSARHW
jgi:hypothetical protein